MNPDQLFLRRRGRNRTAYPLQNPGNPEEFYAFETPKHTHQGWIPANPLLNFPANGCDTLLDLTPRRLGETTNYSAPELHPDGLETNYGDEACRSGHRTQ